ncbi:putative F-box/FBD/LRR-repeat protein At4g03220 isoform X2 [Salvia splendens]|uniref:putative F-box/FBD/LRR-repeat protein At4g03220 isoform X2 n=1 Tax=Salvia splendens TaxID=180675 RepID=UPI001C26E1EA|nr:putative F-box/FBD/LRR-repeat protein At4g03220 isoform X2 [Salvia splendens]
MLQSLFCLCFVRNVQEVNIFSGYGVRRCPIYSYPYAHVDAFIHNVNSLVKYKYPLGFWNLKTLNLVGVHFPDADIAKKVLSDCGVLENLSLERCCFRMIKFLKISAKRLRNLNFVNDGPYWWGHMCMFQGELELHTPNLVSFYYSGPVIRLCQYSDMFFLKNASIKLRNQNNPGGLSVDLGTMISGICHVEELSVSPNFVLYISPEFGGYGRKFSPFDSLRCLKIDMKGIVDHVEGLIKLLQHSPNLEALCIQFIQLGRVEQGDAFSPNGLKWKRKSSRISHWMTREVDVPCLSHNLKEIEIVGCCRDPVNFSELIKFFLQNGKSVEKINITQMEERLNLERFYGLHEVQLAAEAVSVSISSASACGRKELIKLVYGKWGLSVVTETGISKIRLRKSIRIAAKKSGRLVRGK